MRGLPTQKLNPKIKAVWRINDSLGVVLTFAICMVVMVAIKFFEENLPDWYTLLVAGVAAFFIALLIVILLIVPPIRYARWRYELTQDFLDIACGIIWRKRFIIPFIRVQNTDTSQGPVLRMFGLSSVTVSTAAGSHEIPGLENSEAAALRDKAAELARIAREDV